MEKKEKAKDFGLLSDGEKVKALENAISQIEKSFGKGSIMKMDQNNIGAIEVIPTGCLSLDLALGIGGVPRGRIIEIYGPESSGKTTLALHIITQAQRQNGIVAFIDAEHALDPQYATNLGIDLSKLYISQPDNGEQALDITESLVRSGALDVIVVDSVAALTPRAEIEGDMGESHMGLQARLMSQALRKLAGVCNKTKTCIVFINQLREKMAGYGNPEVTPGGKALKFYASIRLDVRKGEAVKNGTDQIGSRTKVKVVKNKLAPPFKVVEFDIIFGKGISQESIILDMAVELGIVQKSGSWFSYNEERLGQGREAVKAILESKPEFAAELEQKVRAAAGKSFGEQAGEDTEQTE